jgi:hypothetical protein
MGKQYNFGKTAKEKARQQKQMDKAAKRLAAKQSKANMTANTSHEDADTVESGRMTDVANGTA